MAIREGNHHCSASRCSNNIEYFYMVLVADGVMLQKICHYIKCMRIKKIFQRPTAAESLKRAYHPVMKSPLGGGGGSIPLPLVSVGVGGWVTPTLVTFQISAHVMDEWMDGWGGK